MTLGTPKFREYRIRGFSDIPTFGVAEICFIMHVVTGFRGEARENDLRGRR